MGICYLIPLIIDIVGIVGATENSQLGGIATTRKHTHISERDTVPCSHIPVNAAGSVTYPKAVPIQIQIALPIARYDLASGNGVAVDPGKTVCSDKITEIITLSERRKYAHLEIVVIGIILWLKAELLLCQKPNASISTLGALCKEVISAWAT
ncbi:hypothetical protein IMSAG025_02010 [Muribaculaceae bacterium]|nr:hypothetical protein IMSAG025_02010 [Muribaculaceae bacterium]